MLGEALRSMGEPPAWVLLEVQVSERSPRWRWPWSRGECSAGFVEREVDPHADGPESDRGRRLVGRSSQLAERG